MHPLFPCFAALPHLVRGCLLLLSGFAVFPSAALAGRQEKSYHIERTAPAPAVYNPHANLSRYQQIAELVRTNFYDVRLNGKDWKALLNKYQNAALHATDKSSFARVMNRLIAELDVSHAAYYTTDDLEYYLLQSVFTADMNTTSAEHIGVTGSYEIAARGVPETFLVRAVLDKSPAAQAGVRPGDRIPPKEGIPFTTVGTFRGKSGQEVPFSIERPGIGTISLRVRPVRENAQQAFLQSTRASAVILEREDKRIGYLHLWCMSDAAFLDALEEIVTGKLAKTDALILDLRDGFGGHPFKYTDVFFRPVVEWSSRSRLQPNFITRVTGYGKPLALLINGGTRSAKEFFAYQIKKTGRGILIGSHTAGAFLGAGGFAIGRDGYLEIPVLGLKIDGKPLEGTGVAPDVAVTEADKYGTEDSQRKAAEMHLLERLKDPQRHQ